MEYYIYKSDDELYHWGIKGMKWGVRRYQNKDGSLTNAGKKRRAKLEGELEKLGGKKKTDGDDIPKKKSVSDMSDAELREHTNRMQLEANYYNAKKNLSTANPKQVSAGKKFAEKMLNETIIPSLTNTGKVYLEKVLKEQLGLKEEKQLSWEDKLKKQTWEKNQRSQQLEDIQREIAVVKAQDTLDSLRKNKKKDDE
jgi:hypothetical protein